MQTPEKRGAPCPRPTTHIPSSPRNTPPPPPPPCCPPPPQVLPITAHKHQECACKIQSGAAIQALNPRMARQEEVATLLCFAMGECVCPGRAQRDPFSKPSGPKSDCQKHPVRAREMVLCWDNPTAPQNPQPGSPWNWGCVCVPGTPNAQQSTCLAQARKTGHAAKGSTFCPARARRGSVSTVVTKHQTSGGPPEKPDEHMMRAQARAV